MKKIILLIFFFFLTFLNVSAKEEFVKNILIDGDSLENFESSKTEYKIDLEGEKDRVKIVFDYDKSLYRGKGSYGDIELNYGLNKISFTLTSILDSRVSKTYTLNITREDLRSSDNSLSSLTVAGKNLTLTDKLEYEVLVDNSLKTASLTAVLNNQKAKFLNGYGERIGSNQITLNGEKTKVEVKVQAEDESIKTYVINIVKKDYKNNDSSLKSLKIEEIPFNFKSNILEYNLTVENNISMINLSCLPNDEKASVDYQKQETLEIGINNIEIRVHAEDGTLKTYKLNITRLEKEYLVKDIKISGIEFDFNPEVFDYEIETNLETLDFQVTLNKETATSNILNNESLENGSVVNLEIIDNEEILTYNFKIVKNIQTEQEEIKDDDKDDITSFLEKYEMYIGLGTFALGLISLLTAILTRPKKSQIM